MTKRIKRTAFFFPLIFALISCVTINVYFPAAAVEKAADRIVDEVWGEGGKAPEKKQQDDNQGRIQIGRAYATLTIGMPAAYAKEADINLTTPAIRSIKGSIQKRAASLKPYLEKGNVGITEDGLLALRSNLGLTLREKATLSRLVVAENSDRMALYREIAKANNFGTERIKDVKELFAVSWKRNARPGWWIQGPDGKWAQKH